MQATNDSSFMSKASMIKLDYASKNILKEYEIFLSSPVSRRAPLINRGYYVRYACMEYFKSMFLAADYNKPLQILSLGCGYDPSLAKETLLADESPDDRLLVVECDLRDVVSFKARKIAESMPSFDLKKVILETNCLHACQYHLLECDLNDTASLDHMIDTVNFWAEERGWTHWDWTNPTLVISECVLTFLPVDASDRVMEWIATRLSTCMFVYYEQIRPWDAFANQMLNHFESIGAPVHSIFTYPEIDDQLGRLRESGFESAVACDMNQWWDALMSNQERNRIKLIEPFDEYEEWYLKCSHYFVGCGIKGSISSVSELNITKAHSPDSTSSSPIAILNALLDAQHVPTSINLWGHGLGMLHDGHCIIFGGYGLDPLTSSKVHCRQQVNLLVNMSDWSVIPLEITGPSRRIYHKMCHNFDKTAVFCFGGRTRPHKALNDLWIFDSTTREWNEIIPSSEKRPRPRWNHGFVHLAKGLFDEEMGSLLLFGGRSDDLRPLSDFWLFSIKEKIWKDLKVPKGCAIPSIDRFVLHYDSVRERLIILGGLKKHDKGSGEMFVVNLREWMCEAHPGLPIINARCCVIPSNPETLFVVGGILCSYGKFQNTIFAISLRNYRIFELSHAVQNYPSLMFINHEVVPTLDGFAVLGGGATCFSMGSFFNETSTVLSISIPEQWRIHSPLNWINKSRPVTAISYDKFQHSWRELFEARKPFVIRGADIGECIDLWSSESYLANSMDANTRISLHVSDTPRLTFTPKNYNYQMDCWKSFIEQLFAPKECVRKYLYFRSIGMNPRKHASNIRLSHPGLAKDINLPAELISAIAQEQNSNTSKSLSEIDSDHYFSSVLRISSAHLQLWTHYDVMDNILIHVTGEKLVTLIEPSFHEELRLPSGINQSSSPETEIYGDYRDPLNDYPKKKISSNPMDTVKRCNTLIMNPGDILYIPALWFHNVLTLDKPAVSVNVFWKHLDLSFYDKRDLYGNKDLLPAIKAFHSIDELFDSGLSLPPEYVNFYGERLIAYAREKLSMSAKDL